MYCVALHGGRGELGHGVLLWRIAVDCDHLRCGHLLRVVHLGDAALLPVGERVGARHVLLVDEDPRGVRFRVSLLEWALRSSGFRRVGALCFRGRVHGSGCQLAEDAT